MDKQRFPIQGGFSITWEAAKKAYSNYAAQFGKEQALERLAERGGFGLMEFVMFYNDIKPWSLVCQPTESHIIKALYDGDIRVERK